MNVSMRVEGGEQLARNLRGLSQSVSNRMLRSALLQAGEPIRRTASGMAQRAPGAPDLADNIGISVSRREEPGDVAVAIGPLKIRRPDQPTRDYGVQGTFLEYGTARHQAYPFMRPAFDSNVDRTLTMLSRLLWSALASRGVSTRSAGGGGGLL